MNKERTYGIIFYKYINNKFFLYLRKNTKEYHEDFMIKDTSLIDLLKNISILNKACNSELNHMTFLLNKDKYIDIFEQFKIYERVEYNKYISFPFVNNIKHKRIKYPEIDNSIKIIRNNYIIRGLIK